MEIQEAKQDIQHTNTCIHVPPRNLDRGCNRVLLFRGMHLHTLALEN